MTFIVSSFQDDEVEVKKSKKGKNSKSAAAAGGSTSGVSDKKNRKNAKADAAAAAAAEKGNKKGKKKSSVADQVCSAHRVFELYSRLTRRCYGRCLVPSNSSYV